MKKYLTIIFGFGILILMVSFTPVSKFVNSSFLTLSPDSAITLQKALPFKIGASLNIDSLKKNVDYRNLVIREFNSVTAENAMKMGAIHPWKDIYFWDDADYLVGFAKKNGKRVHGHTLNWYNDVPDWVKNFEGSTADWEKLLKTHIQTVVSHFRGKVVSWDVVNEAIDEDGNYRNNIWVEKLGIGYIAGAFKYAHEADPDALLFYNDYGHDYSKVKRTAILKLVMDLKSNGIPIHGMGLQMHLRFDQSNESIYDAINTAVATGLKIHVSELDITLNPNNRQDLTYNDSLATALAAKYKFVVETYNAIPKKQQFGITTWNVTDGDSWIPITYHKPDWPLPFDKQFQKKKAYQGILDGVK